MRVLLCLLVCVAACVAVELRGTTTPPDVTTGENEAPVSDSTATVVQTSDETVEGAENEAPAQSDGENTDQSNAEASARDPVPTRELRVHEIVWDQWYQCNDAWRSKPLGEDSTICAFGAATVSVGMGFHAHKVPLCKKSDCTECYLPDSPEVFAGYFTKNEYFEQNILQWTALEQKNRGKVVLQQENLSGVTPNDVEDLLDRGWILIAQVKKHYHAASATADPVKRDVPEDKTHFVLITGVDTEEKKFVWANDPGTEKGGHVKFEPDDLVGIFAYTVEAGGCLHGNMDVGDYALVEDETVGGAPRIIEGQAARTVMSLEDRAADGAASDDGAEANAEEDTVNTGTLDAGAGEGAGDAASSSAAATTSAGMPPPPLQPLPSVIGPGGPLGGIHCGGRGSCPCGPAGTDSYQMSCPCVPPYLSYCGSVV